MVQISLVIVYEQKIWISYFRSAHNHGIVVASRFYESVSLHRLQQRQLAPGERDLSVEIRFEAEPKQDLLLACLWRYVEDTDDESGFYSFAIITHDPPSEVAAAGHDRCVVAIKPEHIDSWLNPDSNHLTDMYAILDDTVDAYYQHELVGS
jgi:putative SOS response-associated peptidase YedK